MCAWYGPPQDYPWKDLHEASADLRGSSPSLWQKEEDGYPLRPQGSEAEARQEVLLPRQAGTRGQKLLFV